MKIIIHDYSGHPFQVQLSRSLARRGHQVLHLFSGSIASPRGALTLQEDDPEGLEIEMLSLTKPVKKYSYLVRRQQELKYAGLLYARVRDFSPEVIISSNTPIDILSRINSYCHRVSIPWILWLQDIQSVAIAKYAAEKLPLIAPLAARYYASKEKHLFHNCSRIIAISEDFIPIIEKIGGPTERVSVIENWAPLDEITPRSKDNAWSRSHDLADKLCFVYSGTLGMKHNPSLLLELAKHFQRQDNIRIIVVSEGLGADFLAKGKKAQDLQNMILLPWQPYHCLSDVLGSADVLLAILEPDAGVLSVPSKVLSNMCASRAQLLAVPAENLAARIVERENAGLVVSPSDVEAWLNAAERLIKDYELRSTIAQNGRNYAEGAFDIENITQRFESIMTSVFG